MDSEKLLKVLETLKSMGVNLQEDVKVGVDKKTKTSFDKQMSEDEFNENMNAVGRSAAGRYATEYLLCERIDLPSYQRYLAVCNLLAMNIGDYLVDLADGDEDSAAKKKEQIKESYDVLWIFLDNCKKLADKLYKDKK